MPQPSKDFSATGAISAVPVGRTGVKYIFPDGSTKIVDGGYSPSYRANSPGLHIVDPAHRDAFIRHVGGIGYASALRGPDMVVFSDREQADRGLSIVLSDKAAAFVNSRDNPHEPTVSEMLTSYNRGGDPAYVSKVLGIARQKDVDAQVTGDQLYNSLSEVQKRRLREAIFRQKGFYNPRDDVNPDSPHRIQDFPAKRGDAAEPTEDDFTFAGQEPSSDDPSASASSSASSSSSPAGSAPSLRDALERRAAALGIEYGAYMPTSALLANVHEREADEADGADADALADRIEHEMDTIAIPMLSDPAADAPPPVAPLPLSRDALDRHAWTLGLPYTPNRSDHAVLADIHEAEADAAPPEAADALADRMERDIDGAARLANIPGFNEDDHDDTDTVSA